MTDKPMTVGDVIEKLKGIDPNLPIVSLHHAACKFYEFNLLLCTLQDRPILAIEPIEKSETMFDIDIFKRNER